MENRQEISAFNDPAFFNILDNIAAQKGPIHQNALRRFHMLIETSKNDPAVIQHAKTQTDALRKAFNNRPCPNDST